MTLLGAYVSPRESSAVWSGGLVDLLVGQGFSEGAARIALTRLVNRDLLARVKDGRRVHYTLTPRTVSLLADGDRRIFSLGRDEKRAGKWTVLWHSIPETHRGARERLVRRLRFLGFGSVQDGTWLAPHDREHEVAALLAELDVTAFAGMMLGRPAESLDVRAFAGRAWDLDALAARYEAFVAEFEHRSSTKTGSVATDAEAFRVRTRMVHLFRQFPSLDPELPPSLVPPPSHRSRAVALFDDLYAALAGPAQRHFDEVTRS
ncbi:PaaX family transcriptional regulator [Amycolatopsis sp. CA-230715]|uniref:PaaX family transcriptional regulator n=1 Tax=Amycolatopsis sp. CA-230715 TaxID=2745196 RepID=UPI001C00AA73|nr:PaaX family transcriptional regulator C-terminal domain-containing protein [Amycolatopsis sp. CA-230715]QWF78290.1 Transcriptional repressor PaaX [Amycolatopsis sp. CA-230715]